MLSSVPQSPPPPPAAPVQPASLHSAQSQTLQERMRAWLKLLSQGRAGLGGHMSFLFQPPCEAGGLWRQPHLTPEKILVAYMHKMDNLG